MPTEDHSLFSIPIRIVDVENHDQVKASFVDWFGSHRSTLRSMRAWECQTKTTFGQDDREIPFNTLRSGLKAHLEDYVTEFFHPQNGAKVLEKEMWLNVYSRGDYQEIHNHLGQRTVVSMAYMLALPRQSGSFVFYQSGDTFFRSLSDFVRPEFSRERMTPRLAEGQAVFFPSFLPHYVSPHTSDELRATISANYEVSHPALNSDGPETGGQ